MDCDGAFDDAFDDGRCPPGPPVPREQALYSKVCSCRLKECSQQHPKCPGELQCSSGFCTNEKGPAAVTSSQLAATIRDHRDHRNTGLEGLGAPPEQHACTLLSREVLTAADPASDTFAVHRLTFQLPPGAVPAHPPPAHVKVRAPDALGQQNRVRAYSVEVEPGNQLVMVVKIYPGMPPQSRGTSAYLGALPVGHALHIPGIRALGWSRQPAAVVRAGMVAFGVGIAEVYGPASIVLAAGGEVRLVYASRTEQQVLLREELTRLRAKYPTRLSVRYCLSRAQHVCTAETEGCQAGAAPLEGVTHGRIDAGVLQDVFGDWFVHDGLPDPLFLVIGTRKMERAVKGLLGERGLGDPLLTRGTGWRPLVPTVAVKTRS